MSYIEREAAKTAIMNCISEQTVSRYATSDECKAARHGADLALFAIDDIPTADVVEVRHGEWTKSNPYNRFMNCSVCGFGQDHTTFKYCPNCGAKMDGEGREECSSN
jgi:hypothetical protein